MYILDEYGYNEADGLLKPVEFPLKIKNKEICENSIFTSDLYR